MRVDVGKLRLFFDVDGAKLVPDGPWMRERPTVLLLHPGPGFDHGLFKVQLGPWLAERAQVVYLDQRGGGRSDDGPPEELRVDRWAEDVRELCDVVGIERPGGADAADAARRYYEGTDEQAFGDFLRLCFPLLSTYELTADVIVRADWSPGVLMGWMDGEARTLDLRDSLASVEAPALVLGGGDDAWAPHESVQEVVDLLPAGTRFRSFPGARHSVFRDAPEAYDELERFLGELHEPAPGSGASEPA